MINKVFLLDKAHEVSVLENKNWLYDHQLALNSIFVKGKLTPVCTISSMITGSKTEAAPGDDDPDPDTECMY